MTTRVLVSTLLAASALAVMAACSPAAQPPAPAAATSEAGGIPRDADGKPDFTGVYVVGGVEDIRDNLAPGSEIVLTDYGQERIKANNLADDPNAKCLPWGPTRMMCCTVMPIAFVNHKNVIVILTESQQTFRLVYMDGRPIPEGLYDAEGNVDPQVGGWMGFSTGRWEGDTLVVETIGADDRTWLDGHGGHQHSSKMKLTERYQPTDANTIQYTATIDDPTFYVKPWSFVKTFRKQPNDRIMSHSCVENERDLRYMQPIPVEGAGPHVPRAGRGGRGAGAGD
jgi:hypothetical protein